MDTKVQEIQNSFKVRRDEKFRMKAYGLPLMDYTLSQVIYSEDENTLQLVTNKDTLIFKCDKVSDFVAFNDIIVFNYEESRVSLLFNEQAKLERGYELLAGLGGEEPVRQTIYAAGTDIKASVDTLIPAGKVVLVPTGITAFMLEDEENIIDCRSGLPFKRGLMLANSRGTIDADYYGKEIKVMLYNFGTEDALILAGERIAQGKFYKVLRPTHEQTLQNKREGGFHSTGIN